MCVAPLRHWRAERAEVSLSHSFLRRSGVSLVVPSKSTSLEMAETLALILWIWIETTRATLRNARSASTIHSKLG